MKHQILCGTIPLTNHQRLMLYRRRLDQWKLAQWHRSLLSGVLDDDSWLPEKVPHYLIPQGH